MEELVQFFEFSKTPRGSSILNHPKKPEPGVINKINTTLA
jgi:hypothetical protein